MLLFLLILHPVNLLLVLLFQARECLLLVDVAFVAAPAAVLVVRPVLKLVNVNLFQSDTSNLKKKSLTIVIRQIWSTHFNII